ncbi:MAG: cell division protein FtsH [Burkholderiales bacterium 28-67-8]|nr:MAG: cell division protein FtsH [Burkholderiales bacterium 28-67-8]
MQKKLRIPVAYVVFAVLAVVLLRESWVRSQTIESVPYSTFERYLGDGLIDEVTVSETMLSGRLKSPDSQGREVVVAPRVEPATAERLSRFNVTYTRGFESTWLRDVLTWLAPAALMALLWFGVVRRTAERSDMGGLIGIGRSKARIYMETHTGVRFADVAGVDEAKAELQEIVEFLKNPKEHGRLGARIPKGVLLMGPTGTGKTLLARAVAGEAGVAFFSISGSEFIEMFVGVGAARVRDLFEQARAHAPAIIFIDELDALGKARGAFSPMGGHDEREQTLNQLLVELDGFDPSVGVVLLAATNRPEILDTALLRAGRFDRQVLVDRPDRRGRLAILQVHIKKVRAAPDLDLDQVAAITVGLAGADLANIVNEAALGATRRRAQAVELGDFTRAVERVVAGIERKTRVLSPHERRVIAHHEMGHALCALALPGCDTVHKVSIIARGIGALGYTLQRPTEDRLLLDRSELMNRITVLLGGRAAERLVFAQVSTGAADDIARATDIARDMVMRHGMDDGLGCVAWAEGAAPFLELNQATNLRGGIASPDTAQRIDAAVQRIVQQALDRALDALQRNRATLDRCAQALLEHETLDEAEIRTLCADLQPVGDGPTPQRGAVSSDTEVVSPVSK